MEDKIILTKDERFYVLLVYNPKYSCSRSDQPLYRIYVPKLEDCRDFGRQMSKNLNLPLEEKL